jgi:signal transduction histidine kinase
MVFGFVRLRTARLKRQHKELAAEVFQATNQVREQKEEIESQRDELLSTNRVLGEQKKELQLMVDNLKLTQSQMVQSEKMASVALLTAGIAHELNNPVNFVGGSVNPLKRDLDELFLFIEKYDKILEDNKLDEIVTEVSDLKEQLDFDFLGKEIFNLLEGIEEGANRSSQIVKGLRSFSRMDEEKCELYNLHEGIDSTLILLQNKIKNRIRIRKEYGDLEEIECFPSKFNQVMLNVLTNSIQAIEGEGEILIQTIRSGIGVKIIIKDSGKGMSPEVKKKIFDPFFTTKEVGEGTGLGLSISFGIIEQHKGHIDVISEPGKGTEFIISLPLTQSD